MMKLGPFCTLTATLILLLTGCVPTISKMYNGPEVSGTLLRLSDFTVVEGATITYQTRDTHLPTSSTSSNAQGHFTLLPVARTQLEMRMPAHSHKQTTIYITHPNLGMSADLVISRQMNREYEKYAAGPIILDDTPTVFAAPLTQNGVDLELLKQAKAPYEIIAQCHRQDRLGAINKLNITRKLAHQALVADSTQAAQAKAHLPIVIQQTQEMWRYLANTCKVEPAIELARLKHTVLEELSTM